VKRTSPVMRWLLSMASRYTRRVSWRHRISIVVLTVLTALPVSGLVCAMLCDSAAAMAAVHHGSGMNCEEQGTPSSGPQMRGAIGHDCSNHDAAVRQAAAPTASRADNVTAPSPLAAVPVHSTIRTLPDSDATFDYRTPPGRTPFTASSLVLRV
jgi:hypothetical protein